MTVWVLVGVIVLVVIVVVGAVSPAIRASRSAPPPTPQGWYPDLRDPAIERFHDGTDWTDRTRPNPDEFDA